MFVLFPLLMKRHCEEFTWLQLKSDSQSYTFQILPDKKCTLLNKSTRRPIKKPVYTTTGVIQKVKAQREAFYAVQKHLLCSMFEKLQFESRSQMQCGVLISKNYVQYATYFDIWGVFFLHIHKHFDMDPKILGLKHYDQNMYWAFYSGKIKCQCSLEDKLCNSNTVPKLSERYLWYFWTAVTCGLSADIYADTNRTVIS